MAIESLDPSTGERVATYPETTPAEVDAILDAAVRAQRAWASASFAERAAPMRRAAALLRERAPGSRA